MKSQIELYFERFGGWLELEPKRRGKRWRAVVLASVTKLTAPETFTYSAELIEAKGDTIEDALVELEAKMAGKGLARAIGKMLSTLEAEHGTKHRLALAWELQ